MSKLIQNYQDIPDVLNYIISKIDTEGSLSNQDQHRLQLLCHANMPDNKEIMQNLTKNLPTLGDAYDICNKFIKEPKYQMHLVPDVIPILLHNATIWLDDANRHYDKMADDYVAEQEYLSEYAYGPCYDDAWQQGLNP